MKTKYKQIAGLFIVFLLIFGTISVYSQNDLNNYVTVNGIVKDKKTKKKLENVSVSVPNTSVGTITNSDGEFTIKVKDSLQAKFVELSHLGYSNHKIALDKRELYDLTILLTPNASPLSEVVVNAVDPLKLVEEALLKIGDNYCPKDNLLSGFYRETIKKGRNYINISEAVVDIYKTDYNEGIENDRTQINKGRKLLSQKSNDTLIVKFQGGPTLSLHLDLVKNHDRLLNTKELSYYKFKMEESVMIDEAPHYVVSFEPNVVTPDALYYGRLYINKESLAFSRAEFNLSMDDQSKVTQTILKKKPFKMHFKPEEVSFLVTYKQRDGISYLNYIKSEIRFKCDWKKRLFSTNYTIVSEMVVTGAKDNNVNRISYKQSFKENQSLSDNVSNFSDENFWQDYNIIEPTESLDMAVGKLKKQYK